MSGGIPALMNSCQEVPDGMFLITRPADQEQQLVEQTALAQATGWTAVLQRVRIAYATGTTRPDRWTATRSS